MKGWHLDSYLDESVPIRIKDYKVNQMHLVNHRIVQEQQPPFSTGIAPCNFFSFSKLKKIILSIRFEDEEDIKRNMMVQLHTISKEEFQKWFDQ